MIPPDTALSHRVLVIDDEAVIAAALRRVMAEEGHATELAESAEEGLEWLNRESFGVALVDIQLPGMSGLEFLEIANQRAPETILILMTGYTSNDQVTEAFARGAFTFLPKPFTFDEAANAVARAFRFRELEEPLRAPAGLLVGDQIMGAQTWGRPMTDRTKLVGVTDVFLRTMPPPVDLQLPALDFPMAAGDVLVRLAGSDGRTYAAWSAVGGQVLETNTALLGDLGLLLEDPFGDGWVARLR